LAVIVALLGRRKKAESGAPRKNEHRFTNPLKMPWA